MYRIICDPNGKYTYIERMYKNRWHVVGIFAHSDPTLAMHVIRTWCKNTHEKVRVAEIQTAHFSTLATRITNDPPHNP